MPRGKAVDEDAAVQPDGTLPQKPTLVQALGAVIAGMVAGKIASYMVTTAWRLATKEDPPDLEQAVRPAKKAAWIALFGAATGAARQLARDAVKPPSEGPA
ncbi:MAG: DUF4235 domain-containing protein [Actinomycetota bacterium]